MADRHRDIKIIIWPPSNHIWCCWCLFHYRRSRAKHDRIFSSGTLTWNGKWCREPTAKRCLLRTVGKCERRLCAVQRRFDYAIELQNLKKKWISTLPSTSGNNEKSIVIIFCLVFDWTWYNWRPLQWLALKTQLAYLPCTGKHCFAFSYWLKVHNCTFEQ